MKTNKVFKITLFICIFLFFLFTQLIYQGANLDNYWNFNNSLQISNGLLPYSDINIITTPLFHYIIAIFLLIIGKNIVVFASITSLLKLIHLILLVKIYELLSEKKNVTNKIFVYIIGTFLMYLTYYEYNLLASLFISFIVFIELKYKNSKNKHFYIGFISSLALLTKQSVGLFVILLVLFKPIIFKEENKKSIIYRFIGIFIPLLVFILYLLITNTFNGFLNYCIFGLSSFNNRIKVIDYIFNSVSNYHYSFLLLLIIVIFTILHEIYLIIKKKQTNDKNAVLIFYSIASFVCFYPISDYHHLLPIIFTLLPIIVTYIPKIKFIDILNNNRIINIAAFIIAIYILLLPIYMYFNIELYGNKVMLKENYNSLNGIVVEKQYKSYIDLLLDYELEMGKNGIDVIILNKGSVVIHLANNKYYKYFDLFMNGNFGKDGEKDIIKEIKSRENTVYLVNTNDIYSNEGKRFQLPNKIIEYVVNNLSYEEMIDEYRIYKIN